MVVQQITDKGSREINEDEMLVSNNLFAVFDGVTSLTRFKTKEGKTGGKIAAEIARQAFSENQKPVRELFLEASKRLQHTMQKEGIDTSKKAELWGTTVAGIRLHEKEIEAFGISDSLILFINGDGGYGFPFEMEDLDQPMLQVWKEMAERKVENIREKVNPMIEKMRTKVNVNYGVLNGEEAAVQFFRTKRMPLESIKTILLFTDGFLIPKEDSGKPEDWDLFVDLYKKDGLQ